MADRDSGGVHTGHAGGFSRVNGQLCMHASGGSRTNTNLRGEGKGNKDGATDGRRHRETGMQKDGTPGAITTW